MGLDIRVDSLQPGDEHEYERMVRSDEHTLLYHSLRWRNLLRRFLGCEDYYLVARRAGRIIGALPSFIRSSPSGNVLNSLPFYGSNGGVVVAGWASDPQRVKQVLLRELQVLAREQNVLVSTVITSPFETDLALYELSTGYAFQDERIGQITFLPPLSDDVEADLMAQIEPVRRRNVRRARKGGVNWRESKDVEDLRFLAEVHRRNIEAIGGLAKKWDFFCLLPELFRYGQDYRLYVAEWSGECIATLLLFYYNCTVEYFTPATRVEFRQYQPTSLLIFEAMKAAVHHGYRFWNWGGTWLTQKGVYDFKKRWGTEDMPYRYYIYCYKDVSHLLHMSPAELLAEYPYFYVIPFSELESREGG